MLAVGSTLGSTLTTPLPLALLPLVGVFLSLLVSFFFIQDLYKPERRVYGGDKTTWLLILLIGSIIGCLVYLLFGREN